MIKGGSSEVRLLKMLVYFALQVCSARANLGFGVVNTVIYRKNYMRSYFVTCSIVKYKMPVILDDEESFTSNTTQLPFPPVTKEHILNCSFHSWHPK